METKETYIALLDRFMRGETSAEEERRLLEWFQRSGSEKELEAFYRQRWERNEGEDLPAEVQNRIFRTIQDQLSAEKEKVTIPYGMSSVGRGRWYRWVMSAAAVLLLCLSVGTAGYFYRQSAALAERQYVVTADKGQRSTVVLPDGTKIWLNSHTRLTYQGDYGEDERVVNLDGEAYFEVAKDREHRFVVKAGGMEVEALGTEFNVKAYGEDDEVTTTLYEGKVQTRANNRSTILQPDESLCFHRSTGEQIVRKDDTEYNQMWRNNELAFRGETLEEIAVLMDRLYNVEVRFESENIKHYRFSGVIKNNSLENVFELISLTAPIAYSKDNDTIVLRRNK